MPACRLAFTPYQRARVQGGLGENMHSLQCPRCGVYNRLGAKFCQRCQTSLLIHATMKTCPSCQTPNRMNARFCAKCGHVFSPTAGSSFTASVRQFLRSNLTLVFAASGVAVGAMLLVGALVISLASPNGQMANRGTNTIVPSTMVAAGIGSPSLSANLTQTPIASPTRLTAGTSAISAGTSTPAIDGLELAKRGTVSIAVPLDSTPGRMVSGSGSVITKRGHILTNNHLFTDDKGKPYNAHGEIYVGFPPRGNLKGDIDYNYQAILVRADAQHDLALIRITATKNEGPLPADLGLSVIPIGDSDQLDIGDQVTILGYPGVGGDTLTLTRGAISGFLPDEGYIKTDAEINPGNSGGPAFNAVYEQIGIASAVFVSKSQTIPGKIGWIRPVNFAKPLVDLAKREAGEQ